MSVRFCGYRQDGTECPTGFVVTGKMELNVQQVLCYRQDGTECPTGFVVTGKMKQDVQQVLCLLS